MPSDMRNAPATAISASLDSERQANDLLRAGNDTLVLLTLIPSDGKHDDDLRMATQQHSRLTLQY